MFLIKAMVSLGGLFKNLPWKVITIVVAVVFTISGIMKMIENHTDNLLALQKAELTKQHDRIISDMIVKHTEEIRHAEYEREKLSRQIERDTRELDDKYNKRLKEVQDEKDAIITGLNNDNIRLSVDLRRQSSTTSDNEQDRSSTTTSQRNATSGNTDGQSTTERVELPREVSEFLIREAQRADEIAAQLGACQNTIKVYWNEIERYNKSLE